MDAPGSTAELDVIRRVLRYHDETKHHPRRPARSSGFMDWESQPHPFRTWKGAKSIALPFRGPAEELSTDSMFCSEGTPAAVTPENVGDFLRHSLGLSAWKQHGPSRWALRVNPSSGNLHPVEGHLVLPGHDLWEGSPAVVHYDPEHHSLALRGSLTEETWTRLLDGAPEASFLVALTSITWREAWKYGERAFRYCQHDTGHAAAALSLAASLLGWRLTRLPGWSSDDIEGLLGLDSEERQVAGEPELGQCVFLVSPQDAAVQSCLPFKADPEVMLEVCETAWQGQPLALSPSTVPWSIIDDVAAATRRPAGGSEVAELGVHDEPSPEPACSLPARRLVRQRRSAVSLVPGATLSAASFERMLSQVLPGHRVPFEALGREPRSHLVLFVHRVEGLVPGIYAFPRSDEGEQLMRREFGPDFLWQRPTSLQADLPLFLLTEVNCEDLAARLSCTQDIAGDGFFSLGMLAELEGTLEREGAHAYRELYWECGLIGQLLYLEAEVAGYRATGIGCYFDDAVHEVLGLSGHALQSLYHFTVGVPFEDGRLTTLPPYPERET